MSPIVLASLAVAGLLALKRSERSSAARGDGEGGGGGGGGGGGRGGGGGGGGGGGFPSSVLDPQPWEAALMDAVDRGEVELPDFLPVTAERGGHQVTIFASADAVRIAGQPYRTMVSHLVAQYAADRLGKVLPTSRMADMAYLAVPAQQRLGTITSAADATMDDEATAEVVSQKIDQAAAVRGLSPGSLVRGVGKDWIASERLLEANGSVAGVRVPGPGGQLVPAPGTVAGCNYGFPTGVINGVVQVIQHAGLRHDLHHRDYSQVLCLYEPTCEVDGVVRLVEDVLLDPELAFLLSDEVPAGRACRVWRHPAIPVAPLLFAA